jgi:hypothetical protein
VDCMGLSCVQKSQSTNQIEKKKGSSFGTTAAASRGVFYESLHYSTLRVQVYT